MIDLVVAVIVLEKSSSKPVVLGQSSDSDQSNDKTRYVVDFATRFGFLQYEIGGSLR
jgi:hypothetical protein